MTTLRKEMLPLSIDWPTIPRLKAEYGYNDEYLRRLCRQRVIKAVKVGNQWLVDPESFEAYYQSVKDKPTGGPWKSRSISTR